MPHDVALSPPHSHAYLIHHREKPVVETVIELVGNALLFRVHLNTACDRNDSTQVDLFMQSSEESLSVFDACIRIEENKDLAFGPPCADISPQRDGLLDALNILNNGMRMRPRNGKCAVSTPSIAHNNLECESLDQVGRELSQHPGKELLFVECGDDDADHVRGLDVNLKPPIHNGEFKLSHPHCLHVFENLNAGLRDEMDRIGLIVGLPELGELQRRIDKLPEKPSAIAA